MAAEVTTLYRWKATIRYRTERGVVETVHGFEEMADLQDIVESGANWNTIENIEVVLARVAHPGLTVEGSFSI